MERPLALIVDSDAAVRAQLHQLLERCEIDSVGAANGDEAGTILRSRAVRLVLADPGGRGVDVGTLVHDAQQLDPPACWIALPRDGVASPQLDAALAVVPLPADESVLERAVGRARRHVALLERVSGLERRLQQRGGVRGFVGRSQAVERLREHAERLAAGREAVTLWGESGSGRRCLARSIHDDGETGGAFVRTAELVGESNDWSADAMAGALEAARGGTLVIEELAACPAARQQAWLEALGRARDVRLMTVLDDEPRALVNRGRIAAALADRLATISLQIPPLRERRDDVPWLAQYFVDGVREINRIPEITIEREALDLLQRYGWPENVRELRNAIERAVILCRDGRIRPVDLPEGVREARSGSTEAVAATRAFRDAKRVVVERFERSYLIDLMRRHSGNVTAASQQAGMLRSALQRLLRKYAIKSADFRTRGRRRRASEPRAAAD